MIATYVLIIVIVSGDYSKTNATVINQEFNSFETCEAARIHTFNSMDKSVYSSKVKSQGCFKK